MTIAPGSNGSIGSSGPSTETSTSRSVELLTAHRVEPRILARGADGHARHLLRERTPALERADAAAKLSRRLQRDEGAAGLGQVDSATAPARSRPVTSAATAPRAMSTSARRCASVNIGEASERAGEVADDAAVVAGDLARMHVLQHAPVGRAPRARAASMTAMSGPPPQAT